MGRKLGKKRLVNKDEVWHPFVATPAYDGKTDVDYTSSLANAAALSPINMMQISVSIMGNGAFIDLARNMFVKQFLEDTDCTHLFFIDADLKFTPEAFVGLARAGMPICAGVYPRRQEPQDFPVKYAPHPELGGLWIEEINDLPWLMCERVPTGFLCIRRDVIEEMAADAPKLHIHQVEGEVPRLFYTKVEDGRFIGEDFCFCDDYRKKYGKNIPVFTNIDFVHGGYPGNLDIYLEQKIAEEEIEIKDTSAA